LDFDVDAGSKVELHQRVHRLRRRVDDVEQALVRAHLKLLPALLVDVRRPVHRETLDPRRQRDRPPHLCACAFSGVHDLARRCIQYSMIERFKPDADVLAVHVSRLTTDLPESPCRQLQPPPLPNTRSFRRCPSSSLISTDPATWPRQGGTGPPLADVTSCGVTR